MVPTNIPDQLQADWKGKCSVFCTECGRSICQVSHHMPFMCSCGHLRMRHDGLHPHGCRDCDCTGVWFITAADALAQVVVIIDNIERIEVVGLVVPIHGHGHR